MKRADVKPWMWVAVGKSRYVEPKRALVVGIGYTQVGGSFGQKRKIIKQGSGVLLAIQHRSSERWAPVVEPASRLAGPWDEVAADWNARKAEEERVRNQRDRAYNRARKAATRISEALNSETAFATTNGPNVVLSPEAAERICALLEEAK